MRLALVALLLLAPAAQARPLVTYARDGGFAPNPLALTVSPKGKAKVTTEAEVRRFNLGPKGLDALRDDLAAARGVAAPKPTGVCSDCFVYSVSARNVSFRLDDSTLRSAAPELRALVARLGRLSARG